MATPYNPTGNSISERINQTITRVLRANRNLKIQKALALVNWALQNQYNRSIGCSPHELVNHCSNYDPERRPLNGLLEKANERYLKQHQHNLNLINSTRGEFAYRVGDNVYVQTQKKGKLDPIWDGPCKVLRIINSNCLSISKKKIETQVNIKQVRFHSREGRMS